MKKKIKHSVWTIYLTLKKVKYLLLDLYRALSWWFKIYIVSRYNALFNSAVRAQNKDFKSIPIIIINFNQLEYLKKLIHFLQDRTYKNIVIIDNVSTFKPLLDYYKTIEKSVTVIRNTKNEGHRVFWKNKYFRKKYGKGYYVVTDSDIVPHDNCPENFLLHFKAILDRTKNLSKVGFSLQIDNIPDTNLHKEKILKWEKPFWETKNKEGHYIADIDTTFALYRPLNQLEYYYFYKSFRLKPPYIAKHGGWYIDHNNLNGEQEYYMKTASKAASWRVDATGELVGKHYE